MSAGPTISIDLRIEDARWEALGDVEALGARALEAAGMRTGEAGEVAILLTNDAEMRALLEVLPSKVYEETTYYERWVLALFEGLRRRGNLDDAAAARLLAEANDQ